MNYEDYLKSPEWKEKRKHILSRDNHKCTICNSKQKLQVHHLSYERLYNEKDNDLTTVCEHCHQMIHKKLGDSNKRKKYHDNKISRIGDRCKYCGIPVVKRESNKKSLSHFFQCPSCLTVYNHSDFLIHNIKVKKKRKKKTKRFVVKKRTCEKCGLEMREYRRKVGSGKRNNIKTYYKCINCDNILKT